MPEEKFVSLRLTSEQDPATVRYPEFAFPRKGQLAMPRMGPPIRL
jgi:hypothetical protein